jgi:hypothetical protein
VYPDAALIGGVESDPYKLFKACRISCLSHDALATSPCAQRWCVRRPVTAFWCYYLLVMMVKQALYEQNLRVVGHYKEQARLEAGSVVLCWCVNQWMWQVWASLLVLQVRQAVYVTSQGCTIHAG